MAKIIPRPGQFHRQAERKGRGGILATSLTAAELTGISVQAARPPLRAGQTTHPQAPSAPAVRVSTPRREPRSPVKA